MITSDQDNKSYSYGWYSPEFNSLLALAICNDTTIVIYKDTGGEKWEKISSIGVPEGANYKYYGSPEPFVAGNNSYISFVLKEVPTSSNYVNSEVWVAGIHTNINNSIYQRCDDGEISVKRTDPESFIGEKEVFIYYNVLNNSGVFEIWRYSTGISTVLVNVMDNSESGPSGFFLFQNYPNPFNPETVIKWQTPVEGRQVLKIFDALGRQIKVLADENLPAGLHQINLNASGLSSGIYYYRLTCGNFSMARKMIFLK